MRVARLAYMFALSIGVINNAFSQQMDNHNNFIEYSNTDKMGMKLDGSVIQDKDFSLKIPSVPKAKLQSTSSDFLHILEFEKGQKIAIIYIPHTKAIDTLNRLGLHYSEFEKLCEKENLFDRLDRVVDFKRNRYFGLKKMGKIAFYILYLNVRSRNVDAFNYSINSIQL